MAAAEVFAFPSTVEGFGLAAMEALAAGVPLVTRDLPVLREVFGGAARFGADPDGLAAALGRGAGRARPGADRGRAGAGGPAHLGGRGRTAPGCVPRLLAR